jgi:hypothetical protein
VSRTQCPEYHVSFGSPMSASWGHSMAVGYSDPRGLKSACLRSWVHGMGLCVRKRALPDAGRAGAGTISWMTRRARRSNATCWSSDRSVFLLFWPRNWDRVKSSNVFSPCSQKSCPRRRRRLVSAKSSQSPPPRSCPPPTTSWCLERQRLSLLRDYLLTLAVNSRFSHGLVQMVQYGPI